MNAQSRSIQRVYLTLLLLHTLSASLIWGINTLFLLDAGLTNAQAFAANAFFTAGLLLFEVPTGVIADTSGRRRSYLLGTLTLSISTFSYLLLWRMHAPFWAWALASAFLGLGFTFFSGAVEAWLVDALKGSGYEGSLDAVFARGQVVTGVAMLAGSVAGGYIAQATNLGVPYLIRALVLVASFALAFITMKDVGFTPRRGGRILDEMKLLLTSAVKFGMHKRPIRWLMLASIFTDGVMIYAFYAMQPYLLKLYGHPKAYGVAGLAAAIVAGAQIAGGLLVPHASRLFRRRTTLMLTCVTISALLLLLIGWLPTFWMAIGLFVLWALLFAAVRPIRQAYINGLIPSEQRATVLSLDSMFASGGGVVIQPLLGRAADVWSYPASYLCSGAIQLLTIPFVWMARRERAESDAIEK
jgi:MFS family permease